MVPMNERGAWVPPTKDNSPAAAVEEGADAPAVQVETSKKPVADRLPNPWDALQMKLETNDPGDYYAAAVRDHAQHAPGVAYANAKQDERDVLLSLAHAARAMGQVEGAQPDTEAKLDVMVDAAMYRLIRLRTA